MYLKGQGHQYGKEPNICLQDGTEQKASIFVINNYQLLTSTLESIPGAESLFMTAVKQLQY